MKILLINQSFYPDVIAVAQYATDLAVALAVRGHEVTVLTGDHGYDDPKVSYSKYEEYRRVRIIRIPYLRLGRKSHAGRLLDLFSFHLNLALKLGFIPTQDVVIGMTLPPFVAFWSALFCRFKGGEHIYWVMDMNPDEAFAAGWLKAVSLLGRILTASQRWIFKQSRAVVALDHFMKERIERHYGVGGNKISVVAPWAHDQWIHPVSHSDNRFRKDHDWDGRFVVMYSGNHSICHPLDTLLKVALHYRSDKKMVFCFVGGGVRREEVRKFKEENRLTNILQFSYEPIENLSQSLSAADLHVSVMGNDYVGIVHPCKVYGILSVGRPFIFIGRKESPTGEWMEETGLGEHVEHGDVKGLVRAIEKARMMSVQERKQILERSVALKDSRFGHSRLEEMINVIEGKYAKINSA